MVIAPDFRLDSVCPEAHDITTTDRLCPQASGGRETLPRSPPATREAFMGALSARRHTAGWVDDWKWYAGLSLAVTVSVVLYSAMIWKALQ